VANCPSIAASFAGWRRATTRALTSPESGWSTAAGAPTRSAMASARRWKARAGAAGRPSSRAAWIPATASPVAAYAASVMWSACWKALGFRIAAIGSTFVITPSTTSKPAGVFIHAFAMTTKTPDAAPLTATRTPLARWARGGRRSHP
jgi:hypothetical protein